MKAQSLETHQTIGELTSDNPGMTTRRIDVFYNDVQAIYDVSLDLGEKEVLALIGPSGCGKSTFLRCLNRMNDTVAHCKISGEISLHGTKISEIEAEELRSRVGMVFQNPIHFPNRSTKILPMGRKFMDWRKTKPIWMR